jgi:putative transposase
MRKGISKPVGAHEVNEAVIARFPKTRWKTLRTTNTIERLHEEFRRHVKTQGSLPTEDAALVLLFSLVASAQIKLRRIDGWQKIAAVLREHTGVAA